MVFGQKRKIRLALAKTHSKEQMEKDRKSEYLHRQLDEVFEHRKNKRKKKRSAKIKGVKKGIEAVDKSLKSKKRTKLGKSVNVNLRNVNRTLGSSTFFN